MWPVTERPDTCRSVCLMIVRDLWSLPWAAEALVPGGVHVLAAVTEGRNMGSSKYLIFVSSSQYGCKLGLSRKGKLITKTRKIFPWVPGPSLGQNALTSLFAHCSRMKRIYCKYRIWGKAHLCTINKRYWHLFRIFLFLGVSYMCTSHKKLDCTQILSCSVSSVMHSESLVLMTKAPNAPLHDWT